MDRYKETKINFIILSLSQNSKNAVTPVKTGVQTSSRRKSGTSSNSLDSGVRRNDTKGLLQEALFLSFFIFIAVVCIFSAVISGSALASETNNQLSAISNQQSSATNSQLATRNSKLETGTHVEGEILIKYKKTATASVKRALIRRHLLKEIREFRRLRMHHVRLPEGSDMATYIAELKKEKHIEYAEPNYKRKPLEFAPNDPDWAQQWGPKKIGMPDTWSNTQATQGVIVAVVDTGADYNHPDLASNMWENSGETPANGFDDDNNGFIDDVHGWNFYCENKKESNPGYQCTVNDPMDNQGHGTHVSGIIGAVANNNLGVAGIDRYVKLIPAKFMEADGDVAAEMDAIDYAVKMGAKIINASYGDPNYSQAEYDAIQAAGQKGVLFVAAAGNSSRDNDGSTKNYPASYNLPNIISVAATDSNDNLAAFSNYGATSVHLAAPGVNILSTIPQGQSTTPGASLTVNSIQYHASGIEFAGQIQPGGLTRTVYNCGYGADTGEFPQGVSGNIALIKRGYFDDTRKVTFSEKVTNAQNAGAVAAVIYNNASGNFSGTLGESGQWIPVVSISMADGETLLALGNPVATLVNYPYGTESGTSMAAPFVSGTAALLWAERPDATMSQIKDAILQSVDAVPSLSGKVITGGRLNAYEALQKIAHIIPYQMTLKSGWNFVSFPGLSSPSMPIETVIADVSSSVRVIWGYDNQTKVWLKYPLKTQHSTLNTLDKVEPDKGYWIYMNSEGTITMAGWLAGPQSITLYDGWNLIGYGGVDSVDVPTSLNALSGKWIIVWGWDNGQWYAKHETISVMPPPVQPLSTMSKDNAYWIKVDSPHREVEWVQ